MGVEIVLFEHSRHKDYLPSFISIFKRCILESNTIATFLPPFDENAVQDWWEHQLATTIGPLSKRTIVMALDSPSGATQSKLVGYVMLNDMSTETGPFRSYVEKLLVDPDVRRKGVGRKMMEKVDEIAWEKGLWLLMLDTETGSPAEMFYPAIGYELQGKIPDYCVSPVDRSLKGGTFFYKDLRKSH